MMIDEMQLSRKNQIEFGIKFSKFQNMLLNINVEAKIQINILNKSDEDDFHESHKTIGKSFIAISKYEENGLIAVFFTSTERYIAMDKMLCGNIDELDSNSREVILFEILEKKKRYRADSLVLIRQSIVDEAVLSVADYWLFKHLRMKFWQKTDYFVNANNNCLFLDLKC